MSLNFNLTDNNLATSNGHLPKYRFNIQVNESISRNRALDLAKKGEGRTLKGGFSALCAAHNNPNNWATHDFDVNELIDIIRAGYSIRGAIKEGGNQKENIKEVSVLQLDFDLSPVAETLAHPFTLEYAAFWYFTPSYVEGENEKHRLGFVLNKPVDVKLAEKILKVLLWAFPTADKSCKDAGRLYFPSNAAENVHIIDVDNVLDTYSVANHPEYVKEHPNEVLDLLIGETEDAKPSFTSPSKSKKKQETQTEDKESITEQVIEHLYQNVWLNPNICNQQVEKLYCLFEPEYFKEASSTGAPNVLRKWKSSNPFSSTNDSKSSFTVCLMNNYPLPLWWGVGFGTIDTNGKEVAGSNYLLYWLEVHKLGKAKGQTKPKWVGKNFSDKGIFKEVVENICKYFDIPFFEFGKKKVDLNEIQEHLKECLADKVYKCVWDKESFFIFSEALGVWDYYSLRSRSIYREILRPCLVGKFPVEVIEDSKVRSQLLSWFIDCWDGEVLLKPKPENTRYIAFENGLYDLEKKELVSNDGRAFNQKKFNFSYLSVEDSDKVVKLFKGWLDLWFDSETYPSGIEREICETWFQLNCQRQAIRTGKILGLVGASGCGKSTYGKMVHGAMDRFSIAISSKEFLNGGNNHATAVFENASHAFIQELKGNDVNIDLLKEISGNGNGEPFQLTVNPKNQKPRDILINCAITFDCENLPKFDPTIDGWFRRILFVKIVEMSIEKIDILSKMSSEIQEKSNIAKLICWSMTMNTDHMVQRITDLTRRSETKKQATEFRRSGGTLATFLTDRIIITNDKADFIPSSSMYAYYKQWCEDAGIRFQMSLISFSKETVKTLKSETYGFGWEFESTEKRTLENGHECKCYSGIKINTEYDEEFEDRL